MIGIPLGFDGVLELSTITIIVVLVGHLLHTRYFRCLCVENICKFYEDSFNLMRQIQLSSFDEETEDLLKIT